MCDRVAGLGAHGHALHSRTGRLFQNRAGGITVDWDAFLLEQQQKAFIHEAAQVDSTTFFDGSFFNELI
jgi:hypothetical protein